MTGTAAASGSETTEYGPTEALPASETKGQRTRRRILEAAIAHFAAVGLDGGSVPEIARQVGISHSALYQHFGRKEDLFRAAVDADLTSLLEHAVTPAALAGGDPVAISALSTNLLAAASAHPLARRVVGNLDRDQADLLRDLPALESVEARLEAAVRTGQREGRLRSELPADVIAKGLVTMSIALLSMGVRLETADFPRAAAALDLLAGLLQPCP